MKFLVCFVWRFVRTIKGQRVTVIVLTIKIIGFELSDCYCLDKFGLNIRYIELELVKYNTPCASDKFLVLLSFLNREASCLCPLVSPPSDLTKI